MNSYIEVAQEVFTHLLNDFQYQLGLKNENPIPSLLVSRDASNETSLSLIIYSCVKPIFKIYLIIFTGLLLSKVNILDGAGIKLVSRIVLAVLLPSLSFNKIVVNIADSMIKEVGIVVLSSIVLFALGAGCGIIANVFFKIPRKWRYGSICASMFPNISDLPIAYLQNMQAVFTEDQINQGVSFVIIFLVAFLLGVFNFGGFKLVEYDFLQANKLIQEDIEGGESSQVVRNNDEEYEMTSSPDTSHLESKKTAHNDMDEQYERNMVQNRASYTDLTSLNTAESNDDVAVESDQDSVVEENDLSLPSKNKKYSSSSSSHKPRVYRDAEDGSSEIRHPSRRMSIMSHQESIQNQVLQLNKQKSLIQDFAKKDKDGNPVPDDPVLRFIKYNSKKIAGDSDLQNLEKWASYHNSNIHELHGQNATDEFSNQEGKSVLENMSDLGDNFHFTQPEESTATRLARMVTTDTNITSKDVDDAGKGFLPERFRKMKGMKFFIFFLENCIRPCPLSVILGLIIAFIPWVKALFVSTNVNMANAPDNLPPLSFIMDFTSYLGAASVPFGLLLLGATLGNLKVKKLPKGFWKAVVFLLLARQVFMPIIGILWCNRLVAAGWLDKENDLNKVLLFVICVDFGLPSMTTMIYLTSGYTPIDADDTTQMDCVSFFLMVQYPLLILNLPFAASYYLKSQLNL